MSKWTHELHPMTVKLHKTQPEIYKGRKLDRKPDFYDEEVALDFSQCDNDPGTFADNPDWLFDVDRADYRQRRIQQILCNIFKKDPNEKFGLFLERVYSVANMALKDNTLLAKVGNDCETLEDRWNSRFVQGCKLLTGQMGIGWGQEWESLLAKLVREECDILSQKDLVFVDSDKKERKSKRAWTKVEEDTIGTTQLASSSSSARKFILCFLMNVLCYNTILHVKSQDATHIHIKNCPFSSITQIASLNNTFNGLIKFLTKGFISK